MPRNWLAVWTKRTVLQIRNRQHKSRTRKTAFLQFESLETRQMLSAVMDVHHHDGGGDHGVDDQGNEWHALPVAVENANTIGGGTNNGGSSPFQYSETFTLHSNPGASHTIYLDFDGHTTSGTIWNSNFNGGNDIITPEYDTDGQAGFSNSELTNIQHIWQRVMEDFAPFDVNVTTEAPASSDDLIKSGTSDTDWGVRVVIGGSSYDWYGAGAGGVAYVGSFNWNSDSPTYVFPDQLGNGYVKYVSEAISHEAGHTLGLSHDGTATAGYYQGHGSGETGWAPIMGVGYYQNLTQWSKGEYAGANQQQDDLAIITTQNGFGYRADDAGNTNATASAANIVDPFTVDAAGLIETSSDVDVFSFTTGAGTISFDVDAFEIGANLDILAELYDAAGGLVTSANPTNLLGASLSATVAAGTYYLHISGTGNGDPQTTGYTDYGSLGQYSFVGSIVDPGGSPGFSVTDVTDVEGNAFAFTVSLTAASAATVTVDYATLAGSATDGVDYTGVSGTLTFLAGETSKTVVVNTIQDSDYEFNESFALELSNASGATISDNIGVGVILDDDPAPLPTLSINDVSVAEGKENTKGKKSGTAQLTDVTFTVTLSAPSAQAVTVAYSTADDSATLADNDYQAVSGTITFNPGETSKTITVTVVGDNVVEPDETFLVQLTAPTNATIADGTGVGTILNDDSTGGNGNGNGNGGGNGNGHGRNRAAIANGRHAESPVFDDSEDDDFGSPDMLADLLACESHR